MPTGVFQLRVDEWVEIHELPDSWPVEQLRELLRLVDFDDTVSDEEAPELAVMALQDLDEREASERVLEAVFGDTMSPGIRQNLVDDLHDDRPWEQFSTLDKQAGLFAAVVLLQRAFPKSFGIPDAIRMRLEVRATHADASAWLRNGPSASLLLRLLASGMEDDAVLKRLYESELVSEPFPDADAILWRVQEVERSQTEPTACLYEIYASHQWLGPLEDREPWRGSGWAD